MTAAPIWAGGRDPSFSSLWLIGSLPPIQDKVPRRRRCRWKQQIKLTAGLQEAGSPGRRADGNGQHEASWAVCLLAAPHGAPKWWFHVTPRSWWLFCGSAVPLTWTTPSGHVSTEPSCWPNAFKTSNNKTLLHAVGRKEAKTSEQNKLTSSGLFWLSAAFQHLNPAETSDSGSAGKDQESAAVSSAKCYV